MSKIHFLPVKHGDAFIIECEKDENKGVVVVDGGPGSCKVAVTKEIRKYEPIDLMVLTHFDGDHIGGLLGYVQSSKDIVPFPVKEMWVNNCYTVPVISGTDYSYGEAKKLADQLMEISKQSPIVWEPYISEGHEGGFKFADIEVVSPTADMQNANIVAYKEHEGIDMSATKRSNEDLQLSMEELAKRPKKEPNLEIPKEMANAASVAFILRCDGLSVLMLGDCYPQNVERYLRGKGYSEQEPLVVDYVKVSHHGSRNNISNELLDIIKCNNYIISANGGLGRANHPDREAIANILCHPNRNRAEKVHLYFNYCEKLIKTNGAPFLKEDDEYLNFKPHYKITELPCEDL